MTERQRTAVLACAVEADRAEKTGGICRRRDIGRSVALACADLPDGMHVVGNFVVLLETTADTIRFATVFAHQMSVEVSGKNAK